MYTVKEIAALAGLSEHTVRYYTDRGLIPCVKRDKNNNRSFDEEALNWFTGVKCLKACGMPIDSIKEYVDLCLEGDATIERRRKIILEQKAAAQIQLREAEQRLRYLEKKAEYYAEIVSRSIPDDTNPGKWEKEARKVC